MARMVIFLQSKTGKLISSSARGCDLILSDFVKTSSFLLLFIFSVLWTPLCFMSVITYKGREVPLLVAFTICL
jgi:hypothetical protein